MKKWITMILVFACLALLFVKTRPVFDTDHVTKITFYAYSGSGIGSDVPAEHMEEILHWLDSFTVGSKAPALPPPGTNTIYVEIEYADGTVIRQGLDTVEIGWFLYYTNSPEPPACYQDILSKTRLK